LRATDRTTDQKYVHYQPWVIAAVPPWAGSPRPTARVGVPGGQLARATPAAGRVLDHSEVSFEPFRPSLENWGNYSGWKGEPT